MAGIFHGSQDTQVCSMSYALMASIDTVRALSPLWPRCAPLWLRACALAAVAITLFARVPRPATAQTCPQTDLGSELPVMVSGTTVGRNKQLGDPSCMQTFGAPDVTFLWTAPGTGTFQIDTHDSDFDTVLWVLDGTCAGRELACNDDDENIDFIPTSILTVDLTAGQQVVIVVSGLEASGNYVLHITSFAAPTPTTSTRLYLRSDPPPVTPAANGSWQDATQVARSHMAPEKFAALTEPHSATETSPTSTRVLVYQFVSPPLAQDHTFSSSTDQFELVAGVQESDAGMRAISTLHAWVSTGDMSAVRCLLGDALMNVIWPLSPAALDQGPFVIGDCGAIAGDRIVLEFGYFAGNSDTTPYTGTVWRGGEGEDLVAGGDPTAKRPGFVTITGDFQFAALGTPLPTSPAASPTPSPSPSGPAVTPTPTATPRPTETGCAGDCTGDGTVTISDLITLVNVALGTAAINACSDGDVNHDGLIKVNEIVIAVNHARGGC
jgi:hypothetical protein